MAADSDLPTPDEKTAAEIKSLIAQLGDESYTTREAATEKLLAVGLPAMKLVEEGAKNPDREIRYRCERLRVMLRDADLQRRLEAFAADVKGEKDHGLPAWDRFAELHGSGAEARQLFVDIFRAEPDLLKAMQIDDKQAADAVTTRAFQLQQNLQAQQPVSLGSIAALLFAGGDTHIAIPDQTQQMIYNLCNQQTLRDAATNGAKKDVLRSMLAKYIVRGEGWVAYLGLNLAMQYDLKEGLEPARKLVKGRGVGQPHLLQMALLAIAKMGSADDLKEVSDLLDDKTVIMNIQINNQRVECQVRDFALVTTLHLLAKDKERVKGTALEGGDLKAFGFDRLEANPVQVYTPHTIGFISDAKRQEVFKKWEELKAKLPKQENTGKK
jgi:hypothetical protein